MDWWPVPPEPENKTLQGIVEQLVILAWVRWSWISKAMWAVFAAGHPQPEDRRTDEQDQEKNGKQRIWWNWWASATKRCSFARNGFGIRPVLFSKILEPTIFRKEWLHWYLNIATTIKSRCSILKISEKHWIILPPTERKPSKRIRHHFHCQRRNYFTQKWREIEEQGADLFWWKSFDVMDLCWLNDRGQGYVNILRLTDIQSKTEIIFHVYVMPAGGSV